MSPGMEPHTTLEPTIALLLRSMSWNLEHASYAGLLRSVAVSQLRFVKWQEQRPHD